MRITILVGMLLSGVTAAYAQYPQVTKEAFNMKAYKLIDCA